MTFINRVGTYNARHTEDKFDNASPATKKDEAMNGHRRYRVTCIFMYYVHRNSLNRV